jgi:hypothetical protein
MIISRNFSLDRASTRRRAASFFSSMCRTSLKQSSHSLTPPQKCSSLGREQLRHRRD